MSSKDSVGDKLVASIQKTKAQATGQSDQQAAASVKASAKKPAAKKKATVKKKVTKKTVAAKKKAVAITALARIIDTLSWKYRVKWLADAVRPSYAIDSFGSSTRLTASPDCSP